MKILIVEDDADKRRQIARVLESIEGLDISRDVQSAGDIQTARTLLKEEYFDLIVLDIVLPMRMDEEVDRGAGVQLLEEILERPGFNIPHHVIGLTAYEDAAEASSNRFERRLLTLLYYDPSSNIWSERLRNKVRHILLAGPQQVSIPAEYQSTLAIICALEDPELRHVLSMPWSWEILGMPGDPTTYYKGKIPGEGNRVVHAAAAMQMGMPASASLSMKMIMQFRPNYIAMPGISAGVPGKVSIGDVIVADPCWDWGNGKHAMRGPEHTFQPAPRQHLLAPDLRHQVRSLAGDSVLLDGIRTSWPGEKPATALSVHLGPAASGAAVLADGTTLGEIQKQHRGLIGIDMEAYGVFSAVEEAVEPHPRALVMKSVVDFADGTKDDKYREYAAFVSARLLGTFAERFF